MTICNMGTISASRPLTAEMLAVARRIFPCGISAECNEAEIIFENVYGDIEEDLKELISQYSSQDTTLSGCISYFGDCEGKYELAPETGLVTLTLADLTLRNASDEELSAELNRRGYYMAAQSIPIDPSIPSKEALPIGEGRGTEYEFIHSYIRSLSGTMPFDGANSSGYEQLRALWTGFCLHNNLTPDTATYDELLGQILGAVDRAYPEYASSIPIAWNCDSAICQQNVESMEEYRARLFGLYMGALLC